MSKKKQDETFGQQAAPYAAGRLSTSGTQKEGPPLASSSGSPKELGLHKFSIRIGVEPEMTIAAATEDEAIQDYMRVMQIRATVETVQVNDLGPVGPDDEIKEVP